MKEAYAVRRTVPPSAEIEAQIDELLAVGVGDSPRESLSELAKLGARLIIQRAVEDEFDAWLGRARYERRPEYQRGLRHYESVPDHESGLRNGFRPRTVQTAEGELEIEIPQVREAADTFASKLFPRTPKLLRTEPLKALVIGAFVRGLSMRDVESLCEQAGLGKLSKSTASRMCEELKERADDLDALVVHLRYPPRHRRRWRSTNLLERSLGEVNRRTKVMGRFPGEESCLTLVWAVLDLLITHQTNGIQFNALDRQRLKRIRYEGDEQTIPEEVTAA
jgi:transposase-like protein